MWKVIIGCILLAWGILVLAQNFIIGFRGQNLLTIPILLIVCGLFIWGGWRLSHTWPEAIGWTLFVCGLLGLLGVLAIWIPWGNSVFLKLSIIGGKIAVFIGSLYAIIYGWTFSHPKIK
jgi:hypothetical protein